MYAIIKTEAHSNRRKPASHHAYPELISPDSLTRSGDRRVEAPITHPFGFIEHRCQTPQGPILSGFKQGRDGAAFPNCDFYRVHRKVVDRLLEGFELCSRMLTWRSYPVKQELLEFCFASDMTAGLNVWASMAVESERVLLYMGRKTMFMQAVLSSLAARKLLNVPSTVRGWVPLLDGSNSFDLFFPNHEAVSIPGFDINPGLETGPAWGEVRKHQLPAGLVESRSLFEEAAV